MSVEAQIHAEHLHTALRVRDLEGALRFYSEVLGLKVDRKGGADPNRPTSVWLPGLQLVRAESQDTAEKGVLDHIGFALHNLDAVVASLEAHNVELEAPVRETTQPNGRKLRLVFFRDPEGNRIELTERS